MAAYKSSEQLYGSLRTLFGRIQEQPGAMQTVQASRMVIRLRCNDPAADVVINGRQTPLQIVYGVSPLHPDLDVDLSAETLHTILLRQLPLRKAIGSGQMKVKGAVHRTKALESVLYHGQALYPDVLREHGI